MVLERTSRKLSSTRRSFLPRMRCPHSRLRPLVSWVIYCLATLWTCPLTTVLFCELIIYRCPWTGTGIGRNNMMAFKVFVVSVNVLCYLSIGIVVWALLKGLVS
jgi:hypothetical protein